MLQLFDKIQKFSIINFKKSTIMNQHNNYQSCSLHNRIFQYFCEKCYEPICKQCTILGPHNTQGHSITTLASAYQRRITQIKQRISVFIEKKGSLVQEISGLSVQIQNLKQKQELSINQNEQYRAELILQLQKSYDRIVNEINSLKQQFEIRLNEINDLGHTFETLQNPIEIIASHSHILQCLKECADRLELLLAKEKQHEELPKVLSDLRLDLKYIQVYKNLMGQKVMIIQSIFQKMDTQIKKIQRPIINYQQLLKQLSINMQNCIEHNICHYCGVFLSIQAANTLCPKNNSELNINQFIGYCQQKPDSSKWATRHHYFGHPLSKFTHYKNQQPSTFKIHLDSLFLKLKTILRVKNIGIQRLFFQSDKHKTSSCDRISMLYVLKQICGLSEFQSQILLTICQKQKNAYDYKIILQRLSAIQHEQVKEEQHKLQNGLSKLLFNQTIQSHFIK